MPLRTRYHLASAFSCPVIRNPGAPTAHLFMWHFFYRLFLQTPDFGPCSTSHDNCTLFTQSTTSLAIVIVAVSSHLAVFTFLFFISLYPCRNSTVALARPRLRIPNQGLKPVQKLPGMAQTGDGTYSPIRAKSGPTSPSYSPIVSRAARSGARRAVCFIPDFRFLTWARPGPQ